MTAAFLFIRARSPPAFIRVYRHQKNEWRKDHATLEKLQKFQKA